MSFYWRFFLLLFLFFTFFVVAVLGFYFCFYFLPLPDFWTASQQYSKNLSLVFTEECEREWAFIILCEWRSQVGWFPLFLSFKFSPSLFFPVHAKTEDKRHFFLRPSFFFLVDSSLSSYSASPLSKATSNNSVRIIFEVPLLFEETPK